MLINHGRKVIADELEKDQPSFWDITPFFDIVHFDGPKKIRSTTVLVTVLLYTYGSTVRATLIFFL